MAIIATEDGTHKKVIIELQKTRKSSDIGRFRDYLGKRYQERNEVRDASGVVHRTSLPIIAVFILGFDIDKSFPACIKVDRRYLDLITRDRLSGKNDFLEGLSHYLYVIRANKLHHRMKSDLERVLAIIGQEDFADERGHSIDYPDPDPKDELSKRILRRLAKLSVDKEVRRKTEFEDEIDREIDGER